VTTLQPTPVTPVQIGDGVEFGGAALGLLAGPCVVESVEHCVEIAGAVAEICSKLGIAYVFKASFDKANRSSSSSFRGHGLDAGLEALAAVRRDVHVPVVTDVHETWQVEQTAAVCDVLQIPAFLCRQTDLIVAAAASGRVVNVKKGQFLAPEDMRNVVDKIHEAGGRALLTERGSSFGYHELVVDFRSLPIMRAFGVPIIFDATPSVQRPGGMGTASGGDRRYVPYLARAAVAVGVDALFLEVHDDPDHAPSDGPNMVRLGDLESILRDVVAVRGAAPPLPAIR
jgi:2-dehydro-3-deoxyphosphooctonate aldolase (KDO 8-P synthase)